MPLQSRVWLHFWKVLFYNDLLCQLNYFNHNAQVGSIFCGGDMDIHYPKGIHAVEYKENIKLKPVKDADNPFFKIASSVKSLIEQQDPATSKIFNLMDNQKSFNPQEIKKVKEMLQKKLKENLEALKKEAKKQKEAKKSNKDMDQLDEDLESLEDLQELDALANADEINPFFI